MRILIDARPLADPSSGGVGRVARELVAAYAETFPDDELVCVTTGAKKPDLPGRLIRPNVVHEHIAIPNKIWSIGSWLGVLQFGRSSKFRVRHTDGIFYPNIGFVGPVHRSPPTVLLLHDLSFLIEPAWFTRKQRMWHKAVRATTLIRSATKLFAVSETTKRDAVRLLGIPEERITVIPLGPTLSATVHREPFTVNRYVLAIGANDPRKNAATARVAVEELKKEPGYEDLELVLIGHNHPHPLLQKEGQGVVDAELASLYANASAFLYPSWYEGYGLPLHEAAQFGTPRVASTSGALPETAPPGTLFANPAKPHHWVEASKMALAQPRVPVQPDPDGWKRAAAVLRDTFKPLSS